MEHMIGTIRNKFQQQPNLYPIMGQWETRFDEVCRVMFTFRLPEAHRPAVPNGLIVLIIRAPPGYLIFNRYFSVSDAAGCVKERPEDACGLVMRRTQLVRYYERRIEMSLPDVQVMPKNLDIRVTLSTRTPVSQFDRHSSSLSSSLWVIELNDAWSLGQSRVSGTIGAPEDFVLNNSVNLTAVAPNTPPDV